MATISKYVYENLIASNGNRAYLYQADGTIYTVMSMKKDTSEWNEIYYSVDEGETWILDTDLPLSEYPLYDLKTIFVEDTLYLFGHGYNGQTICDANFYIKKQLVDDEWVWDDDWTLLFPSIGYNNRITSICTDSEGAFIHLLYDVSSEDDVFSVYYGAFSTTDFTIKFNEEVHSTPSLNQHNGKITLLSGDTLAIVYEQENYNQVQEICYTQYNYITQEWATVLTLTNDKLHNHYHPNLCKDSDDTIHLTWLKTLDSYNTDNIYYNTIVDMEQKDVVLISQEAKYNQHPYIICDENDNLYILFNLPNNSVQYLTKKDGNDWVEVVNLEDNEWQLLYGYCIDDNLYTIVLQDKDTYFVRIDTNLAEEFTPIDDLQINYITKTNVGFAWTAVRNAEEIYLEQLAEDFWEDAVLVTPLSTTDNWAYAIDLPEGKYKFRILNTYTNNTQDATYIDGTFINEIQKNIKVEWTPKTNLVSQELQFSQESWNQLKQIPLKNSAFETYFDGKITKFRLKVVGGVAEGFSNEVRPLTIELKDNNNVLEWESIQADDLTVQQSIDGLYWYKATTTTPISTNTKKAIITNLNNVVYRYRLLYNDYQTSNLVSLTNNLKEVEHSWNSITLQWNSIDEAEIIRFQYSTDNGLNWTNSINPIKNHITIIPKLLHDTSYLCRMHYPNRFTGMYSNIVEVKTNKKPAQNVTLVSNTNTSVTISFFIDEAYSDVKIYLFDIIGGDLAEILLSTLNSTTFRNVVTFDIPNLKKGTEYLINLEVLGSHYGGRSDTVNITTLGDNPTGLKSVSTASHSVVLDWNALDRITTQNVTDTVYIQYSYNNEYFYIQKVNTLSNFTLENLMQDTEYTIKLVCTYGDNSGTSDAITVRTKPDSFAPVYGLRLPCERNFVYADDGFYIMDKDKLYKKTATSQSLIHDYKLESNHVYNAMLVDDNGFFHIVIMCNKKILYCTDLTEKDGTKHDITKPIEIFSNDKVNEFLHPQMKIRNNILMIVWETDYGYKSNIEAIWLKNSKVYNEHQILLNNNLYNHLPQICLKQSGWYVGSVNNSSMLTLLDCTIDNDYNSETYLEETIETLEIELTESTIFNNFNMICDTLDNLHIFYDTTFSVVYGIYSNGSYESLVGFDNALIDVIVHAKNNFILTGIDADGVVYTSKYSKTKNCFTDLAKTEYVVDSNPLCCYFDDDNLNILKFKNGLFDIQFVEISDIMEHNNFINQLWIDNQFSLQNDEEDYLVEIWTNGDINDYPSLYIKCNNIVKDITPLDIYGDKKEQTIIISALIAVENPPENVKSMVQISYNNIDMEVDLTDMLCYTWDKSTVVNSITS